MCTATHTSIMCYNMINTICNSIAAVLPSQPPLINHTKSHSSIAILPPLPHTNPATLFVPHCSEQPKYTHAHQTQTHTALIALCSEAEYPCSNGKCIPRAAVCDEFADCDDKDDESDCACARNEVSVVWHYTYTRRPHHLSPTPHRDCPLWAL